MMASLPPALPATRVRATPTYRTDLAASPTTAYARQPGLAPLRSLAVLLHWASVTVFLKGWLGQDRAEDDKPR